ncbi:EamA family transporter [Candidatus Parcubacteria bacterium]|jgi:drug/metabolite transporter (DMT)-like permease|nr:EamA family transporter [Candidatus Parcubacteria bacterium]
MKKTYVGALSIMLAAFLWAFDGVVLTPWIMKLGLFDVPIFVFMLHAVGSLFLSYFFITKRQELKQLDWKDWGAFVLVGIFGGALGTMGIVGAIIFVHSHHLNISVVLLLQKLQPIFAILLAIIILKERPHIKFYLLALIALIGSYFLTFGFGSPDFSAGGMLVPALLALLAAFSFGSSTVFSKRAIEKVSHGTGTMLRFYITTLVMLVIISFISILKFTGVEMSYAGFAGFSIIGWKLIGAFVVVALTTGIFGIFIYYYGLKRVMATRSTIYEMAFPVSAIVLEWLIHDKLLSIGQWFGTIVLLGAIILITRLNNGYENRDRRITSQ